jgi:hypothetical protein
MICASNCEPVSEIGRTEDVVTASWAELAPGLVPIPIPLPAAEVGGAADGVISGNRLAALPAGTLVVTGVPEPATGIAPMGKATPTLPTGSSTAGMGAAGVRAVEPLPAEPLAVEPLPVEPLADPLSVEPLPVEPSAVEPDEVTAPDLVLDVGAGDAGTGATVTVGALPVAVSGELLQLTTETVAENLIVSPAGAVFGTLSCASICAVAGWADGRARSQPVLAAWPGHWPAMNTGGLNAGVFAPSVSVVAMAPSAADPDQAVIRNRTVPPGGTLVADAETITWGSVDFGVEVDVGVGLPVGVGVGVGVGLVVEGDGEGEAWGQEALGRSVALAAGVDVPDGVEVIDGAEEADGVEVIDGVAVAEGVCAAHGVLGVADGDGAAEAGDAGVKTMPVTPAEMTKRPVARPSVIGRRYGDRMGHLVCGS